MTFCTNKKYYTAVDLPQSTARKESVHETTKRIPEESEAPYDHRKDVIHVAIYSINNRSTQQCVITEYKYTHYIPNTYGNANKYHKKKLEYYQMKKVLLSILEPALSKRVKFCSESVHMTMRKVTKIY